MLNKQIISNRNSFVNFIIRNIKTNRNPNFISSIYNIFNDAIEILKHLAKMPSVITLGSQESQKRARSAALITSGSKLSGEPGLNDVLEILKRMANMNSMVPATKDIDPSIPH